jgi:hypothetical protein
VRTGGMSLPRFTKSAPLARNLGGLSGVVID